MHVAIKAHSKMKCTNIQGHKNKLRTWEKSVTRDCEPECSAAQQLQRRTAKPLKMAATVLENKGEQEKNWERSQQRKEAVTTTGSMQPPRVWHRERENKERLGKSSPPRASSTKSSRQHRNEWKTAVCNVSHRRN